jgi:hypothetical protein
VIYCLEKLREHILCAGQPYTDHAGFVSISVPMNMPGSKTEMSDDCFRIWTSEYANLKVKTSPRGKKRKHANGIRPPVFPFPRNVFQMRHVDPAVSNALAVSIPALSTSFLSQSIPCDILDIDPDSDYYPTALLVEVLSRTEGPLYNAIRGQGYDFVAGS